MQTYVTNIDDSTTLSPLDQGMADAFNDYLEVFLLFVLFFCGVPSNLFVCRQLYTKAKESRLVCFQLLHHMNISDLLILLVYVPIQIGTKIALVQDWTGGDVTCKFTSFINVFCFYASSNIIVSIAFDKYMSTEHSRVSTRRSRIQKSLIVAWLLAVVCALPNALIFKVERVIPESHGMKSSQRNVGQDGKYAVCISRWSLMYAELLVRFDADNTTMVTNEESLEINMASVYSWLHLLLVFYIPALLIILCYGGVLFRVCKTSYHFAGMRETAVPSVDLEGALKKTTDNGNTLGAKARRRVLRITVGLIICYFICWTPYNLISLLNYLELNSSVDPKDLMFLQHVIVLNSVLNPFLYSIGGLLGMCPEYVRSSWVPYDEISALLHGHVSRRRQNTKKSSHSGDCSPNDLEPEPYNDLTAEMVALHHTPINDSGRYSLAGVNIE